MPAAGVPVFAIVITAQSPRDHLHVCHAGRLLVAFTQVEDEFKKLHPNVTITDHSGGSVDLVRRFATRTLECDLMATSDRMP